MCDPTTRAIEKGVNKPLVTDFEIYAAIPAS